jgi:hypothetical protein
MANYWYLVQVCSPRLMVLAPYKGSSEFLPSRLPAFGHINAVLLCGFRWRLRVNKSARENQQQGHRQCSFQRCTFGNTKESPSRYDSVSNSAKLSSLMYRNQRSPEHRGEMCLVLEKFIWGFQTRNCRLRQVAEKREGFVTAKRVRRSFAKMVFHGIVPKCLFQTLGAGSVMIWLVRGAPSIKQVFCQAAS